MQVTFQQGFIFLVLLVALGLFLWGRWRYDLVALMALIAVTLAGIVPADEAFLGFGHPAVVTVAAVLVVSRALGNAGIVNLLASTMRRLGSKPWVQIPVLTAIVIVLSGFMNNIGALAIVMPVAIRMARTSGYSPSYVLMPLAFGSLLGGLTTMIGTPPNIIIASYRTQTGASPFGMFDFTPVGAGVALVGGLFVSILGWRLIPKRSGQMSREDLFDIEDYITELRVPQDSRFAGMAIKDIKPLARGDVLVVGIVRGDERILVPSGFRLLEPGDTLIVEADADALQTLVQATNFALVGNEKVDARILRSQEVGLVEAVVSTPSSLVGRTVAEASLRTAFGVNLLAVARQGERLKQRLIDIRFQAGDVLLLQGRAESVAETVRTLDLLPLAERGLRLVPRRRLLLAVTIFGMAIAATALGALPFQIAFVMAAGAMILSGLLSLREAYESIDWPILVLLGALIPVGFALETTGAATLVASELLRVAPILPGWGVVLLVLVVTMFLSDIVNNAAAAILMAPIAVGVAVGVGASADPFLMAVALGASCAFLTPIGHQSNTLVMGPGGYRFGDYWRMGLPLEIVIALVGVPLILYVWPL